MRAALFILAALVLVQAMTCAAFGVLAMVLGAGSAILGLFLGVLIETVLADVVPLDDDLPSSFDRLSLPEEAEAAQAVEP